MKLQPPITDDDIEALLSGSLPPRRRRVVEDHLAGNPDLRARVNALRADQEALRALGADLLDEPIPERFLRLLSAEEAADAAGEDDGPSGDAALQRADAPPRRRCLGT
ncbi:anti-sigma factor family protein [Novispirillum sp. DQ9]|uniref:anti-sigma factor family protein n=1 Tax=Novispirillum sp. DQ9 TaxID=3398612 RepID=UPI003C79A833